MDTFSIGNRRRALVKEANDGVRITASLKPTNSGFKAHALSLKVIVSLLRGARRFDLASRRTAIMAGSRHRRWSYLSLCFRVRKPFLRNGVKLQSRHHRGGMKQSKSLSLILWYNDLDC